MCVYVTTGDQSFQFTVWQVKALTVFDSRLFLAGSHDAMSYCLDVNSPLVRTESDSFRFLDGLFYCITRPAIFKWATTQVQRCVSKFSSGLTTCDIRGVLSQ